MPLRLRGICSHYNRRRWSRARVIFTSRTLGHERNENAIHYLRPLHIPENERVRFLGRILDTFADDPNLGELNILFPKYLGPWETL